MVSINGLYEEDQYISRITGIMTVSRKHRYWICPALLFLCAEVCSITGEYRGTQSFRSCVLWKGEVAEGLVEWIISKNLKPHDNIANYFINKVQKFGQQAGDDQPGGEKYNQCLAYCAQNGEDLAVIQLKR